MSTLVIVDLKPKPSEYASMMEFIGAIIHDTEVSTVVWISISILKMKVKASFSSSTGKIRANMRNTLPGAPRVASWISSQPCWTRRPLFASRPTPVYNRAPG